MTDISAGHVKYDNTNVYDPTCYDKGVSFESCPFLVLSMILGFIKGKNLAQLRSHYKIIG